MMSAAPPSTLCRPLACSTLDEGGAACLLKTFAIVEVRSMRWLADAHAMFSACITMRTIVLRLMPVSVATGSMPSTGWYRRPSSSLTSSETHL